MSGSITSGSKRPERRVLPAELVPGGVAVGADAGAEPPYLLSQPGGIHGVEAVAEGQIHQSFFVVSALSSSAFLASAHLRPSSPPQSSQAT